MGNVTVVQGPELQLELHLQVTMEAYRKGSGRWRRGV